MTFAWNLMWDNKDMTPHLKNIKVQEIDNGRNWFLNFYYREQLIEQIDLESVRGTEINEKVKSLSVIDEDGTYIGSVIERLQNAFDVNYFDFQASSL